MKWLDYRFQHERTSRVAPYVAQGARALDIACADGALFRLLDGRLGSGVGIDIDPVPTSTAKFQYIRGSFPAALPPGEPFDLVAALAVLEHIPEKDQSAFAEGCTRALRSGGRLVITVPSPRVDDLLRIMKTVRIVDGMRDDQHYGFDPHKAINTFQNAGLVLERHSRFQLGLNNLFVFRKP
jgi:2-polyprenyl-3-methyl-5-hydroxy-6-metoxy-1,4-benzoquinol methylase